MPDRLAYDVRIATPVTAERRRRRCSTAPRYVEGRLDWYAFDAAPAGTEVEPLPGTGAAARRSPDPLSFVPTAASFPGMPNPRFWEMEDRRINFGSLNAKTTDHLLLVFAEMGLVYGNDWFVIPFEMPVNNLCEVLGLVVTDVFGDRTHRAAGQRAARGRLAAVEPLRDHRARAGTIGAAGSSGCRRA